MTAFQPFIVGSKLETSQIGILLDGVDRAHELVDIHDPHLALSKMPEVPEGYEIARIDMVVRLRKKR